MLVTITLNRPDPDTPATDLGFLLHKHADRAQAFDVAAGTAHVFYPEASADRCTAAMLLEVDPVGLVRGRGRTGAPDGFTLGQYVNDRPYAASSLLAVAIGKVFRTALAGRCDARPQLVSRPLPLEIRVPALPTGGDDELPAGLFGPLGWAVEAPVPPVDPTMPGWGAAPYADLRLTGTVRLAEALNHLYVLLPVLDDAKHYWVGPDEVDKLVRAGSGWLASHPERELITRRYLAHQRSYVNDAAARLVGADDSVAEAADEAAPPRDPSLAETRLAAVLDLIRSRRPSSVIDLGCGEGRLMATLLDAPGDVALSGLGVVAGTDVSARTLDRAARRLGLKRMPERTREKVRLFQSSLVYADDRLRGYDLAVLMEVIEHVDPIRLPALERTVFGDAAPGAVIVTTPNAEYNPRYPGLAPGSLRHPDHRFEWTRQQFRDWATDVGERYGYRAQFAPVGPVDPEVGPPTQLAVFERTGAERAGAGDQSEGRAA